MKCNESNDLYIQIKDFLQGYVENEINLSPVGSCVGDCDYRKTSGSCSSEIWCDQTRKCKGTIRNCQMLPEETYLCDAVSFNFEIPGVSVNIKVFFYET